MERRNSKHYSLVLLYWDFITLVAIFCLAYLVRVKLDTRPLLYEVFAREYIVAMIVIIPFWLIIFAILGLYKNDIYRRRLAEYGNIVLGSILGILAVIGWEYVTQIHIFPARLVTLYVLFGAIAALLIERELIRQLHKYNLRRNRAYERVMLIGSTQTTADFYTQSEIDPSSGLEIKVFVGPRGLLKGFKGKSYQKIDRMLNDFDPSKVDTIVQTDMQTSEEDNKRLFRYAQINHLNYRFIPGSPEFYTGKSTVDLLYGYPVIGISPTPLTGWGAIVKRWFDVTVVILTSPIWGLVIGLIALLQKVFNPGPVFYVAPRLSQYHKPFSMYKFRSMAPQYGNRSAIEEFREMGREDLVKEYSENFKVENDPRITKFGNILRQTSLDELPQIFNVLKGDLSLVGPRPIPEQELKKKIKGRAKGALLLSVKSGMTGLWQVSGRSDLSDKERQDLEIYYVRHWSFWLDIKILLRTILVVIKRVGAR
ncbi:MAG: sugar transferase [Candidatus Nanosyncoccaceae bacterium]|jgi:exopolysaccharide biosynthesis polyprenyl glycosylphosphotransferase